ncbi:MAG TPA: hypothetical protein VJ866_20870 [Pyrinomonadaceae bacterium]|nr:hypothetical protein [Pyrinomonadaceae bacterium]
MFRLNSRASLPLLAAGLALLCAGCQRSEGGINRNSIGTNENANIVGTRTQALEEANKKRGERAQQLKAMNVQQLAAEMERESLKGLEPFNSTSFAEAVSRGGGIAAELSAQITKPERGSLLGLLALRRVGEDRYKALDAGLRVGVMVDALKNAKYFNAWGLPHLKWEEAAQALIAEGRAAEPQLAPLLKDERPAPVWGSEDFAEYERYKYRVRDYAWAILREIRGEKGPIPESPAERDRLIQQMQPGTQGGQPG